MYIKKRNIEKKAGKPEKKPEKPEKSRKNSRKMPENAEKSRKKPEKAGKCRKISVAGKLCVCWRVGKNFSKQKIKIFVNL
jgi:hypothetical protein